MYIQSECSTLSYKNNHYENDEHTKNNNFTLATHSTEINSIKDEIQQKVEKYAFELIDMDDYKNKIDEFLSNYYFSFDNTEKFLDNFDQSLLLKFKPVVELDDDGEIDFEWYGRKGARANLTFGKNGELYFVYLFHGERNSSKLFLNKLSVNRIKNELDRIYKDKCNE
jgi:hypothetical protein